MKKISVHKISKKKKRFDFHKLLLLIRRNWLKVISIVISFSSNKLECRTLLCKEINFVSSVVGFMYRQMVEKKNTR